MTITTPWRRMVLHFSQIFSIEVVGGQLDDHPVAGEDADVVHAHLPGDVRQDAVAVGQLHPEHGVREGFDDGPLDLDGAVLLRQALPFTSSGCAHGKHRAWLLVGTGERQG
jgi:hypothetical protein